MELRPLADARPSAATRRGRRRPTRALQPSSGRGVAALHVANRAAGAALVGALLVSGIAQVHDRHEDAARVATAQAETRRATAERVESRHVHRVGHAATARLTGEAVRFAAVRRAEALTAARSAVQTAQAVVVSSAASPDVPAATVAPLSEATARLVALIEATPEAPVAPALPTVATTAAATGAVRTGDSGTVAAARRTVPAADAAARPVAHVVTPATTEPTPAAPTAAPTPGATAAPGDGPAVPVPVDAPEVAVETLHALDLADSAGVLAAAHQLTELSTRAQASAEAAVAAADAAREAAAAAAEAEAEALADRVAAADAAPNGQIPIEVLCAPTVAPHVLLRCDAAAALDELAAAYRADVGRDLRVVSSYRSLDAQVAVKATRGGLAATPGRSNHGRGLAVDLGGFGGVGEFTAPPYLWMKEHAEAYGWHHPAAMEPGGSAPQEPWHWEFDTED